MFYRGPKWPQQFLADHETRLAHPSDDAIQDIDDDDGRSAEMVYRRLDWPQSRIPRKQSPQQIPSPELWEPFRRLCWKR